VSPLCPRSRGTPAGVVLSAVGLLCSACGGPAGAAGAPAPEEVATRFHVAVSQGDGERACALLAPETRRELVQSAQQACPRAVVAEDIPDVGAVQEIHRFGTQAQVRLAGDTVFLGEFAGGWRVVAAACSPRPVLPYDCLVKGV
jgi:hypothetical protein